nr:Histidine kinase dimerization/phosphoacceptor domain protein [Leptospira interrogans serovar Copenhageni/Icterohaemorrhagiae]
MLCECINKNFKIRIPRLPGVYEVYLDNQKVYSNGFVGTNSVETLFLAHPLITNIPVSSGDFYITVNVSTFKGNYLKGGIRKPFLIGNSNTIDFDQKKEEWREIILIVVYFFFRNLSYRILFFL